MKKFILFVIVVLVLFLFIKCENRVSSNKNETEDEVSGLQFVQDKILYSDGGEIEKNKEPMSSPEGKILLPDGLYANGQFENYSYDITVIDVYLFAKACESTGEYTEEGRLLAAIGCNPAFIANDEARAAAYLSLYDASDLKRLSAQEIDSFMNNVPVRDVFGFEPGIGKKGPAGGWVFYDKGLYSDGWRYLEVAPDWLPNEYVFGENGWIKTSTEIGTGYANTMKISSYRDEDVTAAKACLDYSVNGYDDWFLPSKDELHAMYLALPWYGGYVNRKKSFWSSSGSISGLACYLDFSNGNQDVDKRLMSHYVLPIRAF